MVKKIISTPHAPEPIGPYNQAIMAENTLSVPGHMGLIPETMQLVDGGVKEQAEQVMKNLLAVLEAAKMNFDHVVKTSIFLADMDDFNTVNEVYGQYFDNPTAPARETVAVKTLPKKVDVEISMIAVK